MTTSVNAQMLVANLRALALAGVVSILISGAGGAALFTLHFLTNALPFQFDMLVERFVGALSYGVLYYLLFGVPYLLLNYSYMGRLHIYLFALCGAAIGGSSGVAIGLNADQVILVSSVLLVSGSLSGGLSSIMYARERRRAEGLHG